MRRYLRAVLGEIDKKNAEKKREKRLEKYSGGGGITLHLLGRLCVAMLVGAKTTRLRYVRLWR